MLRFIKIFRLLLLSGLCIALVQCKPKKDPNKTYYDTPSEYNDFIVWEQKEVMNRFDDFANSINRNKPDSIQYYLDELRKRAMVADSSVSKLVDFKQDTLFRYAALELFRYIIYACDHELKKIVVIASKDSGITDADINMIQHLSEIYTEKEKEKNDALIAAQDEFSKKFNVIVR